MCENRHHVFFGSEELATMSCTSTLHCARRFERPSPLCSQMATSIWSDHCRNRVSTAVPMGHRQPYLIQVHCELVGLVDDDGSSALEDRALELVNELLVLHVRPLHLHLVLRICQLSSSRLLLLPKRRLREGERCTRQPGSLQSTLAGLKLPPFDTMPLNAPTIIVTSHETPILDPLLLLLMTGPGLF